MVIKLPSGVKRVKRDMDKTIKNIFSNRHQECFANRFKHPLRVHNLRRSQYDKKRSSIDTDDDRFRQESEINRMRPIDGFQWQGDILFKPRIGSPTAKEPLRTRKVF